MWLASECADGSVSCDVAGSGLYEDVGVVCLSGQEGVGDGGGE